MPDAIFDHPGLAAIYDALDGERTDLAPYLALAEELGAASVLDIGCGTGTFALLLSSRGFEVTGLEPARASLDIARAKPGAEPVRWIAGDAGALPVMQADLATMTANVAQSIAEPTDWEMTLSGVHGALRPGGYLVFETRNPAVRAWEEWTPEASRRLVEIDGIGPVETWIELSRVALPIVSFRSVFVLRADGTSLTSDSTLRFRDRDEVEAQLVAHDYVIEDVRDAPDRPGRELVFIARRHVPPWTATA